MNTATPSRAREPRPRSRRGRRRGTERILTKSTSLEVEPPGSDALGERVPVQPRVEVDRRAQALRERRVVERALADAGSSILRSQGADAGWLHVEENSQVIQLKQLLVLTALRNRGLGTSFLSWMKERADRKRKDLTVEVMTTSPARRLLERLDFKAVPTQGNTVTMRY